eukprot:CAMPEP_0185569278 /NCGR_PEP_ID=MMETSP0434-20130131/1951_1 /TAXON_ID=626734 ORGANISM="Favella taraikaensis, Strain Fe Narragansett Bay" /NCGR_SAMPLE_ID=MMETSP0434 /ASSEMBLY_ACC=CAM_ASM_000379 /LENGTH=190 /DNA_ID=CAMNT_0028184017 /DNA_START=94 /DNA_END=666 /DNA_ORIENTATION=-
MIVDWVNRNSVSNTSLIEDCEQMLLNARSEDVLTVAYFGELEGPTYEAHIEASLNWDLDPFWKFVHMDDPSCAHDLGVDYPSISLFRQFDKDFYQLKTTDSLGTPITGDQLAQDLVKRRLPELINFSEDFIKATMEEGRTSVILFTPNVNKDRQLDYFKEFEKVAREHFENLTSDQERLLFVVSGTTFGI